MKKSIFLLAGLVVAALGIWVMRSVYALGANDNLRIERDAA